MGELRFIAKGMAVQKQNRQTHTQTPETIIQATEQWLTRAVIGLNLCPFAKAVHVKKVIRYVVSDAHDTAALTQTLRQELDYLQNTSPEICDTTLLIHPYVLTNFLDYNDFLSIADEQIEALNLVGEIQIASFHPDYRFAGSKRNDIENYSNRSPYPTLHLIRESSIERAISSIPDAERIYERNIETLRKLGHEGWKALMV